MNLAKLFGAILVAVNLAWSAKGALPLTALYSFPAGETSNAGLIEDTNGNFFGTTATGGANNDGTVFKLSPAGMLTTLIQFNGANGAAPYAPLIEDRSGNLYGTASSGGFRTNGTVFKISPAGVLSLLAVFNGTNGATPDGPLAQGTNGYFYGTTFGGGSNRAGTIFQVGGPGTISNLYSFSGTDGANPVAGLIRGSDGNLYGTTQYGGSNGLGTVFRITYRGVLTTLFSFSGGNGAFPGQLVEDRSNNLYGATFDGGPSQEGTIFRLTTSGRFSTVTTFDGPNGSNPNSPLVVTANGLLYGTTSQGGAHGLGVVFQLNPASAGRGSPPAAPMNLASFQGFNGAYPQAGVIEGSDGNFYGTTTSGGASNAGEIFELSGFAPTIISQPASQKWATNGTAKFSVTALGSAPLMYQWMMDSNALASGGAIPGATNNTLTIRPETLAEAGTYYVVVSNVYGSSTSSNAVLEVPAGSVAIRPAPATVTNAALTLRGTASDAIGLQAVQYQLNGAGWQDASIIYPSLAWMATVLLQPGLNVFQARSVDPLGNFSSVRAVNVFYLTYSKVTVVANGKGTVAPAFAGNNLVVGNTYAIRANPRPGNLFSNWSGTITATNNPLKFVMQSNMVVQANFVTNFFLEETGTYNGLFYSAGNVAEQSTGLLKGLTVGKLGSYSGALVLQGVQYSVTGSFDIFGQSTNRVRRSATLGWVAMSLTLNSPEITGTIYGSNGGPWTASLTAERAGNTLKAGESTLLIPPANDGTVDSPPGYGYALLTNVAGEVFVHGQVADGSAFTQKMPLAETGDFPIYASLYSATGFVAGWLNLGDGGPSGTLWWLKPGSFTNAGSVIGSGWTNPPRGQPAVILSAGSLVISGGALSEPLVFNVAVKSNNTLAVLSGSTNSLSGSIDPKTGLLEVSFGNGHGRAVTTGTAAILQNSNVGGGSFGSGTSAGSITLQPGN
ncbi:MAG TPA: choice-of-anchor tandem repeat GloVer-containing protein [Candidatus Saccharimonadales bacterium]|nr:choice-of-anchor tandem repeat GloVer-containing protein [Candidatus Saccharimonadales bacterium]